MPQIFQIRINIRKIKIFPEKIRGSNKLWILSYPLLSQSLNFELYYLQYNNSAILSPKIRLIFLKDFMKSNWNHPPIPYYKLYNQRLLIRSLTILNHREQSTIYIYIYRKSSTTSISRVTTTHSVLHSCRVERN